MNDVPDPDSPRGGARAVALDVLARIDDGAYANLVLRKVLDRSDLAPRDRKQVTDLVYGVTRLRRRLDAWWRPHALREPDPTVRRALRLGVYELTVAGTPPHAAVSATVGVSPKSARGFVNAVLRKVSIAEEPRWASLGEELSYPDWIVDRLTADHGEERTRAWLEAMNVPPIVRTRSDGYVQALSSQLVAEAMGVTPGELVLDLCAAPGGKATLMAREARVVAADARPKRAGLIVGNAERVGVRLSGVVAADGRAAPFRDGAFDRVLLDAPCSGLGVLARRADARWRVDTSATERLADLQTDLLVAAARLTRPGGTLLYSVCTLTRSESIDVVTAAIDRSAAAGVDVAVGDHLGGPFAAWGDVNILAPDGDADDGMVVAVLHRR